ncbi:MAG: BirA family transcriptional regulator, biotin operon repressor / biotin-[acetyl-CoA-carboxylase] ligase [Candidatus Kentron sp. G]|nr:MAG: BirA family transcriptional regulator, biotin operon repressor / biotin-[acetyl-CoA-carboxylase] ligase [Candidatus Kentron sp. G]VFN06005.1 MAG: BirA family transcriptional regulator, biotin operon repressor / biotin-[acetyl-CoA-carboxylase] ligase [Candidatus Kentron sp. G]VFN06984.1 MAG: BirA family transcriptional regulator, biotin operon repressor / biotin-[acetyl-CoA-carboxylase] ligase [Candidatus Kentron sp. G]
MQQRYRLLALLSDGRFHSGEELGSSLGIGRGAVWKLVHSLKGMGIDTFAVRGKGYRLAEPMELLDRGRILAEMDPEAMGRLSELEILPEIDSTNRYLAERALKGLPDGHACFAEYQSAGKGRRGRDWVSPFGANIYLSLLRHFGTLSDGPQGLSLAVGAAVASALTSAGVTEVKLKWPNDLVWRERKLGGVLLELAGEPGGPWQVIVGLGLNVDLPPGSARRIDQPWVDLRTITGHDPGRNVIAGRILRYLLLELDRFAEQGFAPFRARWESLDATRDRPVVIKEPHREIRGFARGVDDTGALLLSVDGRIRKILSGDLSLRVEGIQ